ncbi:MAG: response regulator [Candidatus Riflebacteria bacterium]|nr:response regulator [Candidatus Riflebacteria bacterium]
MKRKKTILLVDDDVDFLKANQLAITAAGFEVFVAANSREALQIAAQFLPDAAVLDVVLNEPDEGFALARKLRGDARTKNIRLIVLSSLNEINRQKGLAFEFSDRDRDDHWLPVDKILDKPIKPKKLIAILEELLEDGA